MDAQEIFDKVATHLFAQGGQATDRDSCMYLAPDGCKCAFGVLIPDELYSPDMEGQNASDVMVNWPEVGQLVGKENLVLAMELQRLHDRTPSWKTTEHMRSMLGQVATLNGLNASILDTLSFEDR